MTKQEIEKAAEKEYITNPDYSVKELVNTFIAGSKFANEIWQEKIRWKSLITEPPTEFGENKQILITHRNGGACIYPLYSNASVEHAVDMGFIEWKEID